MTWWWHRPQGYLLLGLWQTLTTGCDSSLLSRTTCVHWAGPVQSSFHTHWLTQLLLKKNPRDKDCAGPGRTVLQGHTFKSRGSHTKPVPDWHGPGPDCRAHKHRTAWGEFKLECSTPTSGSAVDTIVPAHPYPGAPGYQRPQMSYSFICLKWPCHRQCMHISLCTPSHL